METLLPNDFTAKLQTIKKWFANIRQYENLEYGGLRTLNDIERETMNIIDALYSENNMLRDQRSEIEKLINDRNILANQVASLKDAVLYGNGYLPEGIK